MTSTDIEQLKRRFAQRTGLEFSLLERPAVDSFVRRRCRELGLPDEAAYHELALRDGPEMDRLVQEVSVAETWFFRYPASFELLVEHTAALLRRRSGKLRMLSIACATGEEPYGMAMAAIAAGWPVRRIAIDAFDRQHASLAVAREGFYRKNSFRESLPEWSTQWFHSSDNGTRVDARLASAVTFACRDILSEPLPVDEQRYDVIFCRNLFIYLNETARAKLVSYLSSAIAADGLLLVGHAEYAVLPKDSFASVGVQHSFALRPIRPASAIPAIPAVVRKGTPKAPQHRNRLSETPRAVRMPAPKRAEAAPRADLTLADARAMADAGQLEAAITALEGMQLPQPSRPEMFDLLGSIQLSLGRLEQAQDAFKKVLYFEPDHETALLQLAIVCDRLGNAEQAVRYRRRAKRAHGAESQQSQ